MEKKEIKQENNETKKDFIIGILIGIILIIIVLGTFALPFIIGEKEEPKKEPDTEEKEEKKFVDEYPKVGKDNVFVIKNIDEIIKILENGTG